MGRSVDEFPPLLIENNKKERKISVGKIKRSSLEFCLVVVVVVVVVVETKKQVNSNNNQNPSEGISLLGNNRLICIT